MKYKNRDPLQSDRWYSLAAWRGKNGRRAQQLEAEPLCRFCMARGRVTAATVADHITPHRGDEELFWHGPLQSLCDHHHSKTKQEIETLGYHTECDEEGYPLSPNHPANKRRS